MYTHITKDWKKFELPDQAKFAIDNTIKNNENIRRQQKIQRKDKLGESIDRQLYVIKWNSVSIGKLPRKQ